MAHCFVVYKEVVVWIGEVIITRLTYSIKNYLFLLVCGVYME